MIIDVFCDIGQIVDFKYKEEEETCGFCGGVGTISGIDHTSATCPVCWGVGKKTNSNKKRGIVRSYKVHFECDGKGINVREIIYKIEVNGEIYDVHQKDIVHSSVRTYVD